MDIKYVAKNYKISDKFKDVVEKKLARIEKYFDRDVEVKVSCTEQNDRCKLELTINSSGLYLRSEVESDNMYNNIDLAMPKLERQIVKNNKKYKNKFAERVAYETLEFLDADFTEICQKRIVSMGGMKIFETKEQCKSQRVSP